MDEVSYVMVGKWGCVWGEWIDEEDLEAVEDWGGKVERYKTTQSMNKAKSHKVEYVPWEPDNAYIISGLGGYKTLAPAIPVD